MTRGCTGHRALIDTRPGEKVIDVPKHDGDHEQASTTTKMKQKEYLHELRRLHGELVAMQEWVKASGAKICIVFEGRDTAGKGGTIKAITERVSPRVFRVIALPAPTEREKSQMYVQRYIPHFPAPGEVVIFDRSWYNRAGVEPVMGFCTEEQSKRFLEQVPAVEKAMVDSGIHPREVLARGEPRRADASPREPHRRSPEDLEAVRHGSGVVRQLGRVLTRARRHVRRHRHRLGAVVRRPLRRQAARPAQRDLPPARARSLRGTASEEGRAAETHDPDARCGRGPHRTRDPRAVLIHRRRRTLHRER